MGKTLKELPVFLPQAIQAINGYSSMSAEEFANMIFQKIDVNNDGKIPAFVGIGRDSSARWDATCS